MKQTRSNMLPMIFVTALLAGIVIYGVGHYRAVKNELALERAAHAADNAANEAQIAALSATSTLLLGIVASDTAEIADLSQRLGIVVDDNSTLAQNVSAALGQVAVLDKLRKTDKELLEKYSKVFFLSDNYTPSALATITPQFVFDKKKTLFIHADVQPFLERMLSDAASSSHPISLISAYRSFKEQQSLKNAYTMTFGSGANKFSADQGYSEHQLGTAVDLTTPSLGNNFTNFDSSDAFTWLTENAYRYGFILSYPKNNGYYVYEPWHWRFVGVVLAARLHQEGKNFYDLDQRDIDQYLIDIFDLKETM